MNDKVWKACCCISFLLLIVAAFVSMIIGGCNKQVETAAGGQMPMKCHWAMAAVILIIMPGLVSNIAATYSKETTTRRIAICGHIMSVLMVLADLYYQIGICASAEMQCHTSALIITILCIVAIILDIVLIVMAKPKSEAEPKMKI